MSEPVNDVKTRLGLPTMPSVIDEESVSGLPMARTGWPTARRLESPILANGIGQVAVLARLEAQAQHREVGQRVVGDDLGVDLLLARAGGRLRSRRLAGHVVVGQDVPRGAHDDAGAGRGEPLDAAARERLARRPRC